MDKHVKGVEIMEKILKELDSAYGILSTMSVSHENVQKLAAAESKLQRVYKELKELADKMESEKKIENKEGIDNG